MRCLFMDVVAIRKSISINKEQDEFLRKHHISLSKLVQDAIDGELEDMTFAKRSDEALEDMEKGKYIEVSGDKLTQTLRKW